MSVQRKSVEHANPRSAPRPPAQEAEAELELIGLSKRYGGLLAVDDIALRLDKGEFLSLLGPSGCGKTTTLRMLAGFVVPDAGEIRLRGRDITDTPPHRRDVGLLFQNYALFPHMTVYENVGFGPRMRGSGKAEIRERVHWALDLVRLSEFGDRRPSELSGGQQQRVAVARVLAAGASILLLDEPFSNLDAKLRQHMQDELRELQLRLSIATVHVTHDQEEAMTLSDRVIIMNAGRIEQTGTPEEVYRAPETAFVAEFMGRCNRLEGRLRPVEPAGAALDLGAAGSLVMPEGEAGAQQGEATVFIRPEHISLAPHGAARDGANVLEGEVRRVVFLGARSTVHVRLDDGREILVDIPNPSDAPPRYRPESRVDVVIDPATMRLLLPSA
jgi:spermidine/putrescine ABC transporter ATP-binding subunit